MVEPALVAELAGGRARKVRAWRLARAQRVALAVQELRAAAGFARVMEAARAPELAHARVEVVLAHLDRLLAPRARALVSVRARATAFALSRSMSRSRRRSGRGRATRE